MQANPKSVCCPRCLAGITPEAIFCGKCGQSIRGTMAASAIPKTAALPNISAKWHELSSLLWLYGILLVGSLVFGLMSRFGEDPALGIGFWIVLLLAAGWSLTTTWRTTKNSFILKPIRVRAWIEITVTAFLVYFLLKLYFYAFGRMGFKTLNETTLYAAAGWPVWSFFLMGAVLPGVLEEVVFRGILQPGFANVVSEKEAIVVQAALFSILHLLPAIFISHFLMGLFLGWVRGKTGSIYLCILFHVAWNSLIIAREM